MTERKTLEETEAELKEYSDRLEDRVKERGAESERKQRLDAIRETAAIVGHELRNPLQAILNDLYLARRTLDIMNVDRIQRDGSRELRRRLNLIEKQVEHIDKIASDLDDYARPLDPKRSEVHVQALVEEVISTLPVPKEIEASTTMSDDFPRLAVDPDLMKRLFTHLLTNAIQAEPEGGRILVSLTVEGGNAAIQIQDNGIGIPEENLDRLFVPLFSTRAKGQGFGLAVSKPLVEAHGGTIAAVSEVGKGTAFVIRLPILAT
jgi:signal transduction histidine kinase